MGGRFAEFLAKTLPISAFIRKKPKAVIHLFLNINRITLIQIALRMEAAGLISSGLRDGLRFDEVVALQESSLAFLFSELVNQITGEIKRCH